MKLKIFALVCVMAVALSPAFANEIKGKGMADDFGGGRAPEATGGPDTFGNTFADQASGCTYSWVNLDSPTLVISGDDSGADQALAGAGFDFYGAPLTTVSVSTNGYLSSVAGSSGGDLSNDCPLPAVPSTGSGARIYPLQDDLVSAVNWQYFAACPRPHDEPGFSAKGCNVFQWDGTHFNGAGAVSFQAILYDEVNELVFQFATEADGGSTSTIGIQNAAANDSLTYACNTAASITPGSTAVCLYHPTPVPVELIGFTAE